MSAATAQWTSSTPRGLRIFNGVRGLLAKFGWRERPIELEYYFAAARKKAGLDDFGDEFFVEPLKLLLHCYRTEASLSSFGRIFLYLNMRRLLVNRLRMQHYWTTHPEILEQPVRHPFLIAGLPRTGTTLLYNLLAQDPGNRPLMFWESMAPAPSPHWPKERRGKPAPNIRLRDSRIIVRAVKKLAPKMMSIHPIDADGPEECSRLLFNTFITPYAVMEYHVPSYSDWFLSLPVERLEVAYRDYYRQLQLLQWQNAPRDQWLLKAPAHLLGLQAFPRVLPDVRLIQTHREPRQVVPSTCSLVATFQNICASHVDPHNIGREVLRLLDAGAQRTLKLHQDGSVQTFHLRYEDLMTDPIGVLHQIYEHFGCQLSPEAEAGARRWIAENPANKHGVHKYSLENFGLTGKQVDEIFGEYKATFLASRAAEPAGAN